MGATKGYNEFALQILSQITSPLSLPSFLEDLGLQLMVISPGQLPSPSPYEFCSAQTHCQQEVSFLATVFTVSSKAQSLEFRHLI